MPFMAGARRRDARVVRTRRAILDSFHGLRSRPFDAIRVADIVGAAGVGRSTFYEHFRGKDEVLKHAAAWVFAALADAVTGKGGTARIRHVVEHFRENRCAARGRLAGERICRWLAEAIEERLAAMCRARGATTVVPLRLAATQIAAGQIALVRAWLAGRDPCTSEALAIAIQRTSRTVASSLMSPPDAPR
jgi:AcrR family transcriptional regulator